MKKRFYKLIVTLVIGAVFFVAESCEKQLEVPYPTNSANTATAFTNKNIIDQMMNQLYIQLVRYIALDQITIQYMPGLADDGYNPSTSSLVLQAQTNNMSPIFESLPDWATYYEAIYTANTLLEGIPSATASGFTDTDKQQYIAAVKTIRAYIYFKLVRMFGDVPLITNTDVQVNATKPRETAANVYLAIEKDLKDAVSSLPATLSDKYFINNKYIPEAILAEVYLTQGKWAEAEATATDIISGNNYSLAAITDVFLQSSTEGIMVAPPVNTSFFNPDISYKVGYSSYIIRLPEGFQRSNLERNSLALSPSLLSSFESDDQRLLNWVTVRNDDGYADENSRKFCYKYKYNYVFYEGTVPSGKEEEDQLIRLAEIYLIRAEARARQNSLTNAADDLNTIRTRAGLASTTATSQSDLINAILMERRHELFFEGGHRWFDLVRTDMTNSVLSAIPYKVNWKSHMKLFPIAKDVINRNTNLEQNPGYN